MVDSFLPVTFQPQQPVQPVVVPAPVRNPNLEAWRYGWNQRRPKFATPRSNAGIPIPHPDDPSYASIQRAMANKRNYENRQMVGRAKSQPAPQERLSKNPLVHPMFDGFKPRVFENPEILPRWIRF